MSNDPSFFDAFDPDKVTPLVQQIENGAVRHDQVGIPRPGLLDPIFLLELADVASYGAERHGDNNWKLGMPYERLYSAAQRHMLKWQAGEKVDADTGLSHLAHAAWNLMALFVFEDEGRTDLDNLTC